MDANERFEYMADKFYKDTGMMAPGKDSPAAFGVTDRKERMAAWSEWCETFYSELFDSVPKWISVVDELPPLEMNVRGFGKNAGWVTLQANVRRTMVNDEDFTYDYEHGGMFGDGLTHWQYLPKDPS